MTDSHDVDPECKELPNFQIFTSLRYDITLTTIDQSLLTSNNLDRSSPFYLLSYHLDRLLHAAIHFQYPTSRLETPPCRLDFKSFLLSYIHSFSPPIPSPSRLRIALSPCGNVSLSSAPVSATLVTLLLPRGLPPSPISSSQPFWILNIAKNPTTPSEYTYHKTTRREMYDDARLALPPPPPEREVLLFNHEDDITEGSITTPYFFRDGQWVTPPLRSGGNAGTTRRWALEKGFCVEKVVRMENLVDGEECWISNGVRGFVPGRISLSETRRTA